MESLLAVDLGLKTGLALYGRDGRLCWYRSKNFGSAASLRRGVNTLLNSLPDLLFLVLEGSGPLALIWQREAGRRKIPVIQINAEKWRQKLLYPREQVTGPKAKHHADDPARRIIIWSGLSRPTSVRHDTAEAILVGFWAVMDVRWLKNIPRELRR
ncbi:MAG: hypothetical protein HZA16_00200 [Nitrospirae bacterium]|nr:hypothetical protein [Nitrospirota bacterium]